MNSEFSLDIERSTIGTFYYDYDGILAHKEVKTLFSGVVVPIEWDQDDVAAMGNFDTVVTAEAIQAKNFTNAAEAYTGWRNVQIGGAFQ